MKIKIFVTFYMYCKLHSKIFYTAIKNKFLQEDTGYVSKSKMVLLNSVDLGSTKLDFKKRSCLCRNAY